MIEVPQSILFLKCIIFVYLYFYTALLKISFVTLTVSDESILPYEAKGAENIKLYLLKRKLRLKIMKSVA